MTSPFQRRSSDSWPNRSAAVDCVGSPPATFGRSTQGRRSSTTIRIVFLNLYYLLRLARLISGAFDANQNHLFESEGHGAGHDVLGKPIRAVAEPQVGEVDGVFARRSPLRVVAERFWR